MPFPASRQPLSVALARLQTDLSNLKRIAQGAKITIAADNVSATFLLSLLESMKSAVGTLNTASALPGMAQYAEAQFGESIIADFVAVRDAALNVATYIVTSLPRDANGFLLLETMDAQGNRTARTFSSSQLVDLVERLDALIVTID